MPSTVFVSQSGGMPITSGDLFSGSPFANKNIHLKVSNAKSGVVYLGLPNLSGTVLASGGFVAAGGLTDGMELAAGDSITIPPYRLVSGSYTVRIDGPTGTSGMRLFWDVL